MAQDGLLIRIITVGYGNPAGLRRLLDSLRQHLRVPAEFVLHENGGSREAAERWAAEHPDAPFPIRHCGDGKNIGFGAAVNRAAELEGPWTHLLLMNPDAELLSELGPAQAERLRRHRGICGLRVFDDRARTHRQASARRFPSFITSFTGRQGILTRLWPANPWSRRYLAQDIDAEAETKVDWVSGCALWASREDWRRLGGFDESYFMYAEDVDLGRKAARLGLPVTYVPCVDVLHEGRGSARSAWRSDYYHHMSMWVYHVRWSGPLGFAMGPFVFLGIWLRFLARRLF